MSAPVSPDTRRAWRAARTPVAIVLLVVLAGVVLALVRGGDDRALDPRSYGPGGAHALARLLDGQGVGVEPVFRADEAAAAGGTLLVTRPDLVRPERLAALARQAASVVLVEPSEETLRAVAPALDATGPLNERVRQPGCALPAAVEAGSVVLGGTGYDGGQSCYGGGLARDGDVTVLGGAGPLSNAALADEGNAALAMRLLGEHERLVWYIPSAGDPGLRAGEESLYGLLPSGWVFGAVQAGIAIVLLALWRARRLGPVVTEPLPVVVRAAETVEGRARLYRRAGAADHAAEALRRAARERLLPLLGLPPDAEPQAAATAIGHRAGRHPAQVGALLYGPPPTGDSALVELADALDALENEAGQ
ncbi:DUF4350 domain-containing protein [Qaidamihabitans albus]|uniref:DUF4350 domain-containing protein n=1 Tax=Qaidamihabitans albus TaxID=2795733 RepID=UPI0018F20523|nr:DUF4350 domain-containing protein [Qaidamihabitans albus]